MKKKQIKLQTLENEDVKRKKLRNERELQGVSYVRNKSIRTKFKRKEKKVVRRLFAQIKQRKK